MSIPEALPNGMPDCVCPSIKAPEIKSIEVYKKDDSLIILIEDNKSKPKKDRIFEATDVEGIYDVLDNVKVYRNGKRYYFVSSAKGME